MTGVRGARVPGDGGGVGGSGGHGAGSAAPVPLLLGGAEVAGQGGGGQVGVVEEQAGGLDGEAGVLAEVVAEPAVGEGVVEEAGEVGEGLPEAGGGQRQGAEDVVGVRRLAQAAAGGVVQAADRVGRGPGEGCRLA